MLPSDADLVTAVMKTADSDPGPCRIINVIDGDTGTLMCQDGGFGRARIVGHDTPEKHAPKYDRALVVLTLYGLDVARAMVRAGHARQYGGGLLGSWC